VYSRIISALQDKTTTLSQNTENELPCAMASYAITMDLSVTPQRKPNTTKRNVFIYMISVIQE
jgi:hypothetical protein